MSRFGRSITGGAIAAFAMMLGSTGTAHAYVRESSNWNPGTLPITYYVNQATIPASLGTATGIAAVDGGFASWAAPACTSWRTTDAGNTTSGASTSDRRNVILWISGTWPAELGDVSSVIGVTTPVWSSGGYFIDADIRFNDVGFNWNTTGTGGGGSNVDTQSIATHEEGHFLGLDHSASGTAVMYASYSGGLKRTLTTDDQNGVCAIYPSGVAATDAGVSTGDPCNAFGNTCAGCTPNDGCGFCGDTSQCVSGTPTGPVTGSCGGYVWLPRDCSMAGSDAGAGGTGRFGDPCMSPTDCGSGGLCIGTAGAPTGFCSRACVDDCGCPGGYSCYPTGDPSLMVCAPGTSTCATPTDAGGVDVDAAVVPGDDASVLPGDDGGAATADDSGTTSGRTHAGGCSCRAAGASNGASGLGAIAGLGLLAMVLGKRRSRR